MKIIAVSDIHENLGRLDGLMPVLRTADLLLILGDLTQFGHAEQARRVLQAFRAAGRPLLAIPGNLDHPDVLGLLEAEGISLHATFRVYGDIGIAGMGGSNPTPFGTPFELDEEEIYRKLMSGVRSISTARVRIVASHPPPRGTKTDRVRLGCHVGSQSVRRVVEETQPDLVLCGHIHEAPGEDHIGRTHILNPGPFGTGGIIDIEIGESGVAARIRR